MPCNTIQLSTVELTQVKDYDLLEKALKAEFGEEAVRREHDRFRITPSFGESVVLFNGVATSAMPEAQLHRFVGQIKQAYSREVVQYAAKRFGWTLQRKGANQFTAVKR